MMTCNFRSLVIVLSLGLSACGAGSSEVPKGVLALEPFIAPGFEASDIDGNPFVLDDMRGRWVFVHFWASWCGPCRKEMPSIDRMREQIHGEAWEVVLVNTAEDEDTIFTFLAEVGPELPSYRDPDGLITEEWKPRGLPATYLVDPQGQVRYQALGGRPWDDPVYLEFLREIAQTGQ